MDVHFLKKEKKKQRILREMRLLMKDSEWKIVRNDRRLCNADVIKPILLHKMAGA